MRNILNAIADVLILLAVAIAGVGHMFPWFYADIPYRDTYTMKDKDRQDFLKKQEDSRRKRNVALMQYQARFAPGSGIALGILGFFAGISLLFSWGMGARRVLTLLMFASAITAVVFISLGFSPYFHTEQFLEEVGPFREHWGFPLALAPACVAAALCLLRMIWTMPPLRGEPPDQAKQQFPPHVPR